MKTFYQLSSTHVITPLLEVIIPQMVSAGIKNELSEEHADSTSESLLEITMELLKNIDFEKESVLLVGRSESNGLRRLKMMMMMMVTLSLVSRDLDHFFGKESHTKETAEITLEMKYPVNDESVFPVFEGKILLRRTFSC